LVHQLQGRFFKSGRHAIVPVSRLADELLQQLGNLFRPLFSRGITRNTRFTRKKRSWRNRFAAISADRSPLLWISAALLFVPVALVAWRKVEPMLDPKALLAAPLNGDCELRRGPCAATFADGARVTLEIHLVISQPRRS
jgi:hypothetical protein